jgi:hypothetical protein
MPKLTTTVKMENQIAAQHLVSHLNGHAAYCEATASGATVTALYEPRDAGGVGEAFAEFLIGR